MSGPFPGAHFNNFSWPSLDGPAKEVGFTGPPAQPGGHYLSDPDGAPPTISHVLRTEPVPDIFKFTLYWTLIFHLPFNFIAGIYAFFNFLFPPARNVRDPIVLVPPPTHVHSHSRSHSLTQSFSQPHSHSHTHTRSNSQPQPPSPQAPPADEWSRRPRLNPRRSRWTFALLILFFFLTVSLLSAVVGAAVLAFVLMGVYSAGSFYMSTCVSRVQVAVRAC